VLKIKVNLVQNENIVDTLDHPSPPDPATVPYRQIAIRYGAIWGGVSILTSLVGYMTNTDGSLPDTGPIKWVYSLIGIAIAVWAIATAIRADRDQQLGGYIGLGRCIGIGALTGVIAGAIGAIFTLLYMTVINPGFKNQLEEMMVAQWEEQGMSEEQIEMALSMSSAFTSPAMLAIWQTLGGALLGLLIGLAAGLVMKRERVQL
jgi:MFS family permease